MRKRYSIIIGVLVLANISIALLCNHTLTIEAMDEKITEILANNNHGCFGRDFRPENYLIAQTNGNIDQAFIKLVENSDLIIQGKLSKRAQQTDLVVSDIQVSQVHRGNKDLKNIQLTELYNIERYDPNEIARISLIDPFYCAVSNNTEYIFFLKEIYPNMYSYTDKLYTKFPCTKEVITGFYEIYEQTHCFDAKTFFSSDILKPLSYDDFIVDEHHVINDYDYSQSYLDFYKEVKRQFLN